MAWRTQIIITSLNNINDDNDDGESDRKAANRDYKDDAVEYHDYEDDSEGDAYDDNDNDDYGGHNRRWKRIWPCLNRIDWSSEEESNVEEQKDPKEQYGPAIQ